MLLRRSDILTLEGGGAKLMPLRRIYNSQLRGGWDWPWQQYDEYGLEESATLLATEVVHKARNGCRYEDTLKTFRECCRKAMDKEIIRDYVQDSRDKGKTQRYRKTMAQQASTYMRWRSVCVYGTAALALAALAYYYMTMGPTPGPEASPPPPLTCPTMQHANPAGTACEHDTFVDVVRDSVNDLKNTLSLGNPFKYLPIPVRFGGGGEEHDDLAEKYMRMLLKRVIPKDERKALLDEILPKPKQKKVPKKKKTAVDTQCMCLKKDGSRCSFSKQRGLDFCGIHKKNCSTLLRGGVKRRTYRHDVKTLMLKKSNMHHIVAFDSKEVYRVDREGKEAAVMKAFIISARGGRYTFKDYLLYSYDVTEQEHIFEAWTGETWVPVNALLYNLLSIEVDGADTSL